jgi:hypothetical protein
MEGLRRPAMKITRWTAIIHTLFALLLLAGIARADWTDNWTFNGIRLSEITHSTWAERGVMALGVATAYGVHFAGHALYLKSQGLEWHMSGLSEIVDEPMTNSQRRWMGRIGFISANGIGWAAKLFGADGLFWRSYNIGCAFETVSYPLFSGSQDGDDIQMINDGGGNGDIEWAIYSVSSLGLLVK